jgi:hypothetical protein
LQFLGQKVFIPKPAKYPISSRHSKFVPRETQDVIRFRLDDLLGSFQKSAAELAAIGSVDSTEVVAGNSPKPGLKDSLNRGVPVDIYLPGRNFVLGGFIVSYEQSANQTVRQTALTATG